MAFQYFHRVFVRRRYPDPLRAPRLIQRPFLIRRPNSGQNTCRRRAADRGRRCRSPAPGALADECAIFHWRKRIRKISPSDAVSSLINATFGPAARREVGIHRLVIAAKLVPRSYAPAVRSTTGKYCRRRCRARRPPAPLRTCRIPPFDEFTDPSLAHVRKVNVPQAPQAHFHPRGAILGRPGQICRLFIRWRAAGRRDGCVPALPSAAATRATRRVGSVPPAAARRIGAGLELTPVWIAST